MSSLPTPRETWQTSAALVGRSVLVFDELESTNTFAAQLPGASAPDGTVILAVQQTAGRGRFGRVWQSRAGSSLLMSVVLYPPPELRRPAVLTAWASVAIGDAILKLSGLQARIKWPNDLLIRGKKVCGILIEQGVGGAHGQAPRTVVGIGLNLNQPAEDFAAGNLPDAASLGSCSGRSFDLRAAAEGVLGCLDAEYSRLLAGERVAVEADWKWRIGLLGKHVLVEQTDGTFLQGRLREMSFDAIELEIDSPVPLALAPERVAHIRAI